MPEGVRLDVDQARRLHLGQLCPGHRIVGVGDRRGIDEQRDGDLQSLDQREHVRVDGAMAVVDGQHHGALRHGNGKVAQRRHQRRQGNDLVAALLDQLELGLEHRRRHRHLIGRDGTEAMIEQDRNGGRIGGMTGRADEQQQANDGRQPSTNMRHARLWATGERKAERTIESYRITVSDSALVQSAPKVKRALPSCPCCDPRTGRSVPAAPCRGRRRYRRWP